MKRHPGGTSRQRSPILLSLAAAALPAVVFATAMDPFALFGPGMALNERERSRLDAGEAFVRVIPSRRKLESGAPGPDGTPYAP